MTEYRYIFGSLRTEKIIADIDLQGTYMDLELNVGGRFDGSFHLDQTGKRNADMLEATVPGQSFVCVERNGKPIWIGYVWSRTYQSQAKSVQLYAQSFEYYPTHQLVRSNFSNLATDQITIFANLWAHMQAVPGRNMNINLPTNLSSITRDVEVKAFDYKFYSEVITSFADTASGFDWTVDINKSGSNYIKTLRAGHPRLGSVDPSLLTFEYPGSILNYYATESMAEAGNFIYVLGAGEGSSMIVGADEDSLNQVGAGLPRWDYTVSRKDVNDQSLANSLATQEGHIRRPPRLVVKPNLKAEKAPEFGSFSLGDACVFSIMDARFPQGVQLNARVVKWALQPQSADNTDEYSVILAGDESE